MTLNHALITVDPIDSTRVSDAHVADAVARHRTLLARLEELSERQRELAGADDGEAVLTLVTMRAALIGDIRTQAERLSAIAQASGALPPAERATLDEELSHLDQLTAQAVRRDEADRLALTQARDRLARELRELSTGRRATAAYGPEASPGARLQDSAG